MLASHFHDEIVGQFWISLLILFVSVMILAAAVDQYRHRIRRALLGVSLCVALAGGFLLAEIPALRHNHLCHGHGSDACDVNHNRADHAHWFGGRTAQPRS